MAIRLDVHPRHVPEIDPGSLALELQRSLDYYESHFDQTPIPELIILPDSERARALASALAVNTGLRASTFDFTDRLDIGGGVAAPDSWQAFMAIGAALRAGERET